MCGGGGVFVCVPNITQKFEEIITLKAHTNAFLWFESYNSQLMIFMVIIFRL